MDIKKRHKVIDREWKEEITYNTPATDEDPQLEYNGEVDISSNSSTNQIKQGKVINNLALSLTQIPGLDTHHSNIYSYEQKISAVVAYFVTGSIEEASKYTGIKASTVRKWKQQDNWWNLAVREVKRAKQEQLDTKLTNLIEKTMSELRDRLMKGDEVVSKGGTVIRKKVSARDLATIANTLYDKRSAIRKDPLNEQVIDGKEKGMLMQLKSDFEKMSNEFNAKVIEGERVTEGTKDSGRGKG